VIDLYEATLDPRHLEFALALAEAMIAKFYDPAHGGFYQSVDSPDLIIRAKEDYDGAEPSANSVSILALFRLAAIAERKDIRDVAEKSLRLFAPRMKSQPEAVPNFLSALAASLEEPRRVAITGDPADKIARQLLRAAHSVYQPNKVILGNVGPVEPFARSLPLKDAPMAYVCAGTACQPPTREPEKIREYLK